MIDLNLVDYPEMTEDYDELGRHYSTPTGKRYPSVTTILGREPKPQLEEWRQRMGEEKADRYTKTSGRVGSEFHDACEQYVLGKDVGVLSAGARQLFASTRRELNNLSNIRGVEIPMWSDYLKLAGRSDLIGDYKNKASIVDYKNSRKLKSKEFCRGYFLQGAAYSRMFYERHGIAINQIVIIIGVWGQTKPQVFIEKVKDWIDPLDDMMRLYNPMWK